MSEKNIKLNEPTSVPLAPEVLKELIMRDSVPIKQKYDVNVTLHQSLSLEHDCYIITFELTEDLMAIRKLCIVPPDSEDSLRSYTYAVPYKPVQGESDPSKYSGTGGETVLINTTRQRLKIKNFTQLGQLMKDPPGEVLLGVIFDKDTWTDPKKVIYLTTNYDLQKYAATLAFCIERMRDIALSLNRIVTINITEPE